MSVIREAWNKERLDYQKRYYKANRLLESSGNGGTDHGRVLEMSWVLINIFGLTQAQVEEVERDGFTNKDVEEFKV